MVFHTQSLITTKRALESREKKNECTESAQEIGVRVSDWAVRSDPSPPKINMKGKKNPPTRFCHALRRSQRKSSFRSKPRSKPSFQDSESNEYISWQHALDALETSESNRNPKLL